MDAPETFQPLLISAGLRAAAARTPAKIALRMDERTMSYRELADRSRQVAGGVATDLQIVRGDRIALFAPNCIEYAELVVGIADAGAIVVTLNPRSTPTELAAACSDCAARALFVHPSLASVARSAALSTIDRTIVLGPQYERWLALAPAGLSPQPAEIEPFTLVYSSGTTGAPKGILISHRSRVLTFHAMAMEYGCFGPDDTFLALAPLAHGAGFAFAMASLYFGGTCEIVAKFDAADVLSRLAAGEFSGVFMVPTHFHSIFALDRPLLARHQGTARSLKSIISNAAALPQPTKEKIVAYFGAGLLHESYGSTEAGVVTNIRPADQLRKPQSVGRPFAATQVRLLDDDGEEVAPGDVGELYSLSPFLFNGYWNRPDETRACVREGWVTAGDLARRDEDGFVYIVDRKKDLVISGGLNIFPREIEEALHRHPSVQEASVIGVPDQHWGERLRAFIVVRAGASVEPEQLAEHCRKTLSGYKIPREFRFIDALPRNAGGKVLKNDLRALND